MIDQSFDIFNHVIDKIIVDFSRLFRVGIAPHIHSHSPIVFWELGDLIAPWVPWTFDHYRVILEFLKIYNKKILTKIPGNHVRKASVAFWDHPSPHNVASLPNRHSIKILIMLILSHKTHVYSGVLVLPKVIRLKNFWDGSLFDLPKFTLSLEYVEEQESHKS